MRPLRSPLVRSSLLLAATLIVGACDSSSIDTEFPGVDVEIAADGAGSSEGAADVDRPDDGTDTTPDGATRPVRRVRIDLDSFVDGRESASSSARAYRADADTGFVPGPTRRARPGDFVLENQRIRAFVERYDETISPCSYGGNLVDGLYKAPDGRTHGDVVGEICPLINAGMTVKPTRFDIVRDGGETGVAAVAVTGVVRRLDFLNIQTMVPPDLEDALDVVPFDPDGILPLTVSMYYLLEHDSNVVQMLTAFRNDGDEKVHALFGHLVKAGGHGSVFNPLNRHGGFGADRIGRENINGTPLPYLGFLGEEASFSYVPEPDPELSAELPVGGGQISAAGVGIVYLGETDLADVLLAQENEFEQAHGMIHLAPGETTTYRQYVALGDGGLESVVEPAYERMPLQTGRIVGVVRTTEGEPLEDARVSAVRGDRTLSQDRSSSAGRFGMAVPPGSYRLLVRTSGRSKTVRAEVAAGEVTHVRPSLTAPARVSIQVEAPSGDSVPARVTVKCVGGCPAPPTGREKNVSSDSLPGDHAAIEHTNAAGRAEVQLEPGTYRISVTRGLEWSVWPADAPSTGGHLVDLEAGETASLSAEIAHVVDTKGALGGDFHVHGIRSADSVVTKRDRVMNFVSEGVDVLVSTDHDIITDYGPVVDRLDVGDEIVALRGDEITTSDIGHFNAFPLPYDPTHRAAGALDWGRGPKSNLPPSGLYAWAHDQPGEQVVQVNHPASRTSGLIAALEADVLHGTTHADSSDLRLPGGEPDPKTGDTGYWSDDFTAMELMNGTSVGDFWPIARWWMTMIGRGFTPTGTAVTDTHELYQDLGGTPRTYAFVDENHDTPSSFDRRGYVEAVNGGRAIGTNGPFFRLTARNGKGARAGLGETIRSSGGTVTLEVRIDTPVWLDVDRVDVFSNVESVVTGPGEIVDKPIPPTKSVPVDWKPADTSVVADGDREHRHRTKRVDVELQVSNDAWVIVVVRADDNDAPGMRPVVPDGGSTPFAFSNPILVDADGNGYDNPPLADEAASPPNRSMMLDDWHGSPGHDGPESLSRRDLGRLMESFRTSLHADD